MASRQDRGENESDNRDNSLRALLLAAAGAGTIAAIVIVLAYVASNGQVSEAMNVTKTDPTVTPKPEAKVADKVVHDKPGYTGKEEKQPAPTQPAEGNDILQTLLEPLTKAS
ncbi:MAG: hypothetical protein E6K85_01015 [Thaumarchaeota archaeon]|nr:MAG: hypothetical protein E6K85_01015 [Nitrososphaerota archaeon]